MTVYKYYYFDIAKRTNFANSLKELNVFFAENGIVYEYPVFAMKLYGKIKIHGELRKNKTVCGAVAKLENRDQKIFEEINSRYPHFSEYYDEAFCGWKNYTGRALFPDGSDICVRPDLRDDRRELEEILLKYPRTYSFCLIDYSLREMRFSEQMTGNCFVVRMPDDGNKHTNLTLELKMQNSEQWKQEEAHVTKLFEEYFSCKKVCRGMRCELEPDEKAFYEKLEPKAAKTAHKIRKKADRAVDFAYCKKTNFREGKYEIGKSLKNRFHTFLKPRYECGVYTFEKRDCFNNIFRLELDKTTFSGLIRAVIHYEGAGFKFSFPIPQYAPETQEALENYLSDVERYAALIEEEVLAIGRLYPVYPEWI